MYASRLDSGLKYQSYSGSETESQQDPDEAIFTEKTKVTCICPKCGEKHGMNLVWIGRGTPRKYCQQCKERI